MKELDDNILSGSKDELEDSLNRLPDEIADALELWRRKSLDREVVEAKLYLSFKGQDIKYTAEEVKSMVRSSEGYFNAKLEELKSESNYQRLYERLLSNKRRASMRVAY